MLDEKDLQAISKLMDEKIRESEDRTLQQAARNTQVIVENVIMPQFKLLAEGQQTILETLTPKSKTEELEEEIDFLKAVVRSQSQRIEALEKRLA